MPPNVIGWAVYEDQFADRSGVEVFAEGDYVVPRRFFGTWTAAGVTEAFEVEVDRGRFLFRQLVERRSGFKTEPFELDHEHIKFVLNLALVISGFVAVKVRQTTRGLEVELARRDTKKGDKKGYQGWFDAYTAQAKPHKPQRGRPLEPEHFERVAEVYRAAIFARRSPTRAVSKTFDVPHSTAARWVMEARKGGHLLPAPARGQPGEKRDTNG